MSYPTVLARATVVRQLVSKIADATGVATSWGPPADIKADQIVITFIEGDEFDIPTMKAGRKHRDDVFTVRVWFFTAQPGRTADKAVDRIHAMVADVDDLLADDPKFGEPAGLRFAELADLDGPDPYPLENEGYGCEATAGIRCHTRLN